MGSRKSSRSKRKAERKVGSGRKGTVDEEEYLLKSLIKLVDRFAGTRGKFRTLNMVSRLLIAHHYQRKPRTYCPTFTSSVESTGRKV